MSEDRERHNTDERLEGIALGQYHAVRAILHATVGIVGLIIAFFVSGAVALVDALLLEWEVPDGLAIILALLLLVGLGWFIFSLIRSFESFQDHQAVHRRLLALRPYTSWVDRSQSGV